MAHYAFLDKNNVVTEVIVGIDENELIEGKTPEQWYGELRNQKCLRTSYNGNIRYNFAGVGFSYDEYWDAFIPPQPFPSWKIDYSTFTWKSPIPYPDPETGLYRWSEPNQEWILLSTVKNYQP